MKLIIANTRYGGIVSEFGTFKPWLFIADWLEFMEKLIRENPENYEVPESLPTRQDFEEIFQFEVDMILSDGPRFTFQTEKFDKVSWMPIRFELNIPTADIPRESWLARTKGRLCFSGQIIHWIKKTTII